MEEFKNIEEIKEMFVKIQSTIDEYPNLSKMNFGIFYQEGRLGFVDLDAFAKSTKVRLEEGGEEKTLTELQQDIDKKEE